MLKRYSTPNSRCSTTIASGHVDGNLRIWDTRTSDCTFEIGGVHTGQITSLNLSSGIFFVRFLSTRLYNPGFLHFRLVHAVNILARPLDEDDGHAHDDRRWYSPVCAGV